MRINGGHLPKVSGRPLSVVEEIPLPEKLQIDLTRRGVNYQPVVGDGQQVEFGDSLAEASVTGANLCLPSPVSGRVSLDHGQRGVKRVTLEPAELSMPQGKLGQSPPERISADAMRDTLAEGGIWPFFWSSRTGGMPVLGDTEWPRAIIVNSVLTEPFRARGKVILRRAWDHIMQGLRFLPRLLADYGTMEIVLTAKRDPVARMIYVELAGRAWVHFHSVPLLYPVESPRILHKALQKSDSTIKKDDVIWTIDIQGVETVGACFAEGLPLHQRVVALGGPGQPNPRHVAVRIGTPLSSLCDQDGKPGNVRVLRGGLLNGVPVDSGTDSVQYDDDAFFFLPEESQREFLSFLRPGFDRTSVLPSFISRITGAADSRVSSLLRGERRPCIACGLCEDVCPAKLMPQVLHRYLYGEARDEAEAAGLELCVDCNLCTYVCPSKIELSRQFAEAREQLRQEREEARVTAAKMSEETRREPAL